MDSNNKKESIRNDRRNCVTFYQYRPKDIMTFIEEELEENVIKSSETRPIFSGFTAFNEENFIEDPKLNGQSFHFLIVIWFKTFSNIGGMVNNRWALINLCHA